MTQVTVPSGLPFGFIQVAKLENQVFRFFLRLLNLKTRFSGFFQVAKLENQVFRFFSGCET